MLHAEGRLRRVVRILVVSGSLSGSSFLLAAEKHWIAHEAQAIVVGTFEPNPTFPWFDGWHVSGVITVDEVLYGNHLPREIIFRFVCRWNLCQWWPPPHYPEFALQKGLWFLRRIDQNTWESANGFSDTGFRYLSDRDTGRITSCSTNGSFAAHRQNFRYGIM
jgi:hypothetical protein